MCGGWRRQRQRQRRWLYSGCNIAHIVLIFVWNRNLRCFFFCLLAVIVGTVVAPIRRVDERFNFGLHNQMINYLIKKQTSKRIMFLFDGFRSCTRHDEITDDYAGIFVLVVGHLTKARLSEIFGCCFWRNSSRTACIWRIGMNSRTICTRNACDSCRAFPVFKTIFRVRRRVYVQRLIMSIDGLFVYKNTTHSQFRIIGIKIATLSHSPMIQFTLFLVVDTQHGGHFAPEFFQWPFGLFFQISAHTRLFTQKNLSNYFSTRFIQPLKTAWKVGLSNFRFIFYRK